ncbi:hypothetical protein E8E13_001039 [Curvularia kusanoi]|uniref:Carbohydrate-binding-like protein n=1 Tax=Curvularia kusanoi TaxID=90978 RepID=A0A9P4T4V4_CURKU|nr:hypothetical protein E8E13_001039 [Curvularia kusanoi]
MRYSVAFSGLLGLAAAAPQRINIEAALDVPTPTVLGPRVEETKPAAISYNPNAAASAAAAVVKSEGAIEKRDACAVQPAGAGPVVSPDTAAAFSSAPGFSETARGAGAPSGYKQSFVDKNGSSQQIGYLTYKTYNSYDVQGCANDCDSEKYCLGFNIYFERDPSLEPGPNCPNPSSTTTIKCSLYGYPVASNAATNVGQWRQDFQVVIAGSNGYSKVNKALPDVKDFKAPTSLPAAINAPLDNGYDTYNGMRLFNDNPYDPSLCAAACQAQTDYDKAHPDADGTWKPCNFFTSYILTQNGVPLGTYCSLYTRSWDSSYAVNTGYYSGSDEYDVIDVGSYEIINPSTGGTATPKACAAPTQGPCDSTSYTSTIRFGGTYSQTYMGCGVDNVNDDGAGSMMRFNPGISLCDARNYCANRASGSSTDYAPNGFHGFTLVQYTDNSLVCFFYVNGEDAAASAFTKPDSTIAAAYGYSRG